MKNTLIRLHTTDNNGNFDCDFHDDIIIKENTEIALHSLSVERQNKSIIIDSTNAVVQFQISSNVGVHNVSLPHGLLSRVNFVERMNGLTDVMNSSLRFFRGTPTEIENGTNTNAKETGMQIKVHTSENKNVIVDFLYSECTNVLTSNASGLIQTNNMNVASNRFKSDDNTASNSIDNLQHSNLTFKNPISLGTHISRCRVRQFANNDGATSGFIMGITTNSNKIINNSLTLGDMNYGLRIKQTGSIIEVKNGKSNPFGNNGLNQTLVNFAGGGGGSNNDVLSIEIRENVAGEGQKLFIMHYNAPAGNAHILLQADIDLRDSDGNDIPYFFFISLLGKNDSIQLDHVGSCRNQFLIPIIELTPQGHPQAGGQPPHGLTLPPNVPATNRSDTDMSVTFSSTLADYLGFDSAVNEYQGIDATFTGNRQFQQVVGSDNYIIEMLNLNINTYDSFEKGRKNVLAYVPVSETIIDDSTGIVQYEPKERLFLPLANEYSQTLRNIRARIVANDYSQIDTEGLSSLNILLRS
jgi:hypothetical protein